MNGIHDIADFIVAYSVDNKIDLTHKKLQKLLYYAHGFYLVIEKKPLFDAKLEAWKYGPVNKAVWDSFKSHGYLSITKPKNLGYRSLEGGIKNYLALFLYSFISISQDTLIDMSHTDAVWDLNYIPGLNKEISSEEMGLYFGEFKDFIEYRSFADQKVNFLKLIKARIDYFFALEDIGNGWDSSGSPEPSKEACASAIDTLKALQSITFSKAKPVMPKILVGPIPIGGVTLELHYPDKKLYIAIIDGVNVEVSLEVNGFFTEQEFALEDFNDDIGAILGEVA